MWHCQQHNKQRQSKTIDMRFYWVQDRKQKEQFKVYWRPGTENLADYVTKHHTAKHHQRMRPLYLHQANLLQALHNFHQSLYPSHCEGVLIPSTTMVNTLALGITNQHNPIHNPGGQGDRRHGEPHKLAKNPTPMQEQNKIPSRLII